MGLMVQRGEETEDNDIHIIIMERMFVCTHMHVAHTLQHWTYVKIY